MSFRESETVKLVKRNKYSNFSLGINKSPPLKHLMTRKK